MYTPFQVAKVFGVIRGYLLQNPLVFAKEGVFRVPGTDANSQKIVADILNNKKKVKFPSTKNADKVKVHDYISALKLVLNESKLLDPTELNVEMLKSAMEDSKDPNMAAHELEAYIHNLIISTDIREKAAGEVFYTYFQLAKVALSFQDKNKMTAENLGKVIGPNFEKMMSQDKDPVSVFKLIEKLNAICALMLQEETYSPDFERQYYPQMIEMREKLKAKLADEQRALELQRETYAQKKAEYHKKLAAKKAALKKSARNRKELVKAEIADIIKTIEIYEQEDKECEDKLTAIDAEKLALEAEIEALSKKYPEQKANELSPSSEQQLRDVAGALMTLNAANEPNQLELMEPANVLVISSPKPATKEDSLAPVIMKVTAGIRDRLRSSKK